MAVSRSSCSLQRRLAAGVEARLDGDELAGVDVVCLPYGAISSPADLLEDLVRVDNADPRRATDEAATMGKSSAARMLMPTVFSPAFVFALPPEVGCAWNGYAVLDVCLCPLLVVGLFWERPD
jgi:hypothetical protein